MHPRRRRWGPRASSSRAFCTRTGRTLSSAPTRRSPPSVAPDYGILKPFLASGQRYLLSGEIYDYALVYNDYLYVQWWNLIDDSYIKYPIPGRGGNWHATTLAGRTCAAENAAPPVPDWPGSLRRGDTGP